MLTLAVMLVTTPFTLKGTRSMIQMQQLQPEMKKLQSQYKDDRQKLNEELMAFYKENGLNPLGGCLPLIIQMPVFFILFRVVRGLVRQGPQLARAPGQLRPRKYLSKTSDLLRGPAPRPHDEVLRDRPGLESAMQVRPEDLGFGHGLPSMGLVADGRAVTSYYQQKQITRAGTRAPRSRRSRRC